MIATLILLPVFAAVAVFFLRDAAIRRTILVVTAFLHAELTMATWMGPVEPVLSGWLDLDAAGRLVLSITSGVFLAAAVYGLGYFRRERKGKREDFQENFLFSNASEATFTGCLLLFLAMMTLMACSMNFGLLWIALEASTLASAPLIYYHRQHRSLEASWKYLMIGSVGIALALLANFFLAVAASNPGGEAIPMVVSDLVKNADSLQLQWLRAAFLFYLVGYGTKMGLAPLHTWLPDAHSEAPSIVSALMSGALLNCAFLGILRAYQVCVAADQGAFCESMLRGFGLVSMALAAVFIMNQADFKRMLAYSSVEHMGILALGASMGTAGLFGAFLHAINHSIAKAMLFLVSGNIAETFKTKDTARVKGLIGILPISGTLWFAGFLAITGVPPFGTFLSEFTILGVALKQGLYWVAGIYLALLALIFVGMLTAIQGMVHGKAEEPAPQPRGLRLSGGAWLAVAPPAALGVLSLVLGFWVPPPLATTLNAAAQLIGGR